MFFSGAIMAAAMLARPEGGWAVLSFFGFGIIGAPGVLITLHLMEEKSKARRN
jgi:hypothetical protein